MPRPLTDEERVEIQTQLQAVGDAVSVIREILEREAGTDTNSDSDYEGGGGQTGGGGGGG